MATIRGYAELYRNGGLDEPSALDDAIRRTEQEAVRMGSLVDDLLHLPASTKDARSSRSRSTSRRWRSMPPVMRARSPRSPVQAVPTGR